MRGAAIPLLRPVEAPDRRFAARERAALVAIEARQPSDERAREAPAGHQVSPRLPHAEELDLRRGDPVCALAALGAGLAAGNRACQRLNIASPRRIAAGRECEAMPARVSRRARFAGQRLGARA